MFVSSINRDSDRVFKAPMMTFFSTFIFLHEFIHATRFINKQQKNRRREVACKL